MFELFLHNGNLFYAPNPYVEKNSFFTQPVNTAPTCTYKENKDRLPLPVWEGHDDTVACYEHVLETAFSNFKAPDPPSRFV
ncbi:MAG: hypothetical protein IKU17_08025, partial [Clostridia bacterium]|nr:hypothetical protein [Clostridia bacterium]